MKMNLIPHHLCRFRNVLENPNISPLHTIHRRERDAILQRVLPLIEFPKHLKEITNISQILLGWTHSIPSYEKILCHSPKVIRQCKKRWSIVSLLLQRMHQSGLRVLKSLLNCNMLLVFTFLWAINQAKALALEGTFEFHKN